MKSRTTLLVLVSLLLAGPLYAAEGSNASHRCRPVGTWLIDVTFPFAPTPTSEKFMFKQLLVLNADRTLQETNTGLHGNTSPLAVPQFGPPDPNRPPTSTFGSDGFGAWNHLRGCRIQFSFLKFVYAGDPVMPPEDQPSDAPPPMDPPMGPPPKGIHIGFLKVSGTAKIVGHAYSSKQGEVTTEIIVGMNPFTMDDSLIIDTGPSFAGGMRLLAKERMANN